MHSLNQELSLLTLGVPNLINTDSIALVAPSVHVLAHVFLWATVFTVQPGLVGIF